MTNARIGVRVLGVMFVVAGFAAFGTVGRALAGTEGADQSQRSVQSVRLVETAHVVQDVAGRSAIAGDGDVVYSNSGSDLYFPPGAGRRIADDILTEALCNCLLTEYSFTVAGSQDNAGAGTGDGFSVEYALYDDCPNGGGSIIPGTEGVATVPDDGTHVITHVAPFAGLELPRMVWLAVEFDNATGGWLVGAPPEIGFSDDVYDFPAFDCAAEFAGSLFASFAAEISCTALPPQPAVMPQPENGAADVSDTPTLTWNNPLFLEDADPQPQDVLDPADFVDATRSPDYYVNAFQAAIAAGEIEDPRDKPFPNLPPARDFGSIAGIGAPPVTADDLYLFEDSNDILVNTFSLGQALELMRQATIEVLTEHGDSYDFVAFFLNFQPDPQSQFGGAFYSGLQNDVSGLGISNFNSLNQFGLGIERLQGWVMMWDEDQWSTNKFSFGQLVLGQEFEHRFGMYLAPLPDAPGGTPRPLQGPDNVCGRSGHWNFRVDGQGSGMEIAEWVGSSPANRQGGTLNYCSDIPNSVFSYPDLYLMGYVSGEEMDNNASELRYMDTNDNCSSSYDGPISTFDSVDIVSQNGVRVPSSFLAQKNFNTAWIVIHRPGAPPTTNQFNRMTTILNHWNDTWVTSTLGRGVMTNVLEPPDPYEPTYDVLIGTENPPNEVACANVPAPQCEPGLLASETTHFWQVITQKPGAQTASDIWSFTTESCGPAAAPVSPSPENNATNVELVTDLTWANGESIAGTEFCATSYTVYFGQDNPPTQILCQDMSFEACDAPLLDPSTVYYWQVEATTPGGSERSPIWTFTSRPCSLPTAARMPFPADETGNIPIDVDLTWNNENKIVTFSEVGGNADLDGLTIGNVSFSADNPNAFVLDIDGGSEFIDFPAAVQQIPIEPISMEFEEPVYAVSFAYLFSLLNTDETAVEATFYDESNEVVEVVIGSAMNFGGFGAEGFIDYLSATAISRADLVFTFEGAEFMALDNIGYNTLPVTGELCGAADSVAVASGSRASGIPKEISGPVIDAESVRTRLSAALAAPRDVVDATNTQAGNGGVAGGIACPPTYDVYFGEEYPPVNLICEGVSLAACDPGPLELSKTYYWQVSTRAPGQVNPGPIWSFSTPCQLIASTPSGCQVDARQNLDPAQPVFQQGWRILEVEYACDITGSSIGDFEISVEEGQAPFVLEVSGFGTSTSVELLSPIPAGQITCMRRSCTQGSVCLGSLPGDVDGDHVVDGGDILTLRDHLDGEIQLEPHQYDIDRNTASSPEDLLRLIDLLNGAGPFDAWYGETLSPCEE